MKITFLGTNGWYDTNTGNTNCILVETDDYYIVLDAGNGLYKLDEHITSDKPIHLFISHFHLDHISGLHILNKFKFSQGINIYGQKGTKEFLNNVIRDPYTISFNKLPLKVRVNELNEGWNDEPFKIKCAFLNHNSKCLGFRFEIEDQILTYCTDTGIHKNIIKLGKNADMMITECSFKNGQYNPDWLHLNPLEAFLMAKKAGAKRLALTHFDPSIYNTINERDAIKSQIISDLPEIIITHDNMKITV